MRWVAILVAATLTGPALRPATAQQSAGPGVPLAELLNAGFEIKGAVLAGILVQNGPLAYICTTTQRERPVDWTCLPLNR
ncbi:MAG: hypothetical protein U1E66_12535 [Rhodospirillales bacterium]